MCLGHEIVVAAGCRGMEHLGDDRQPGCGCARRPHGVVHGQLGRRHGAGIARGGGQLHGLMSCLGDLGTGNGFRSVPQGAGQRGKYKGPQVERAVRRLQLL